jgi:trigger factor
MTTIAGLKVDVTEVGPVIRDVRIEIPWTEVETRIARRFTELRRTMRPVRGFRKGKVPQWILEQQLGPQVELEVSRQLLSDSLVEAFGSTELVPLTVPEVKETEGLRKGHPFVFTVQVEVQPRLDDVVYNGLALTRVTHEVDESDIDREIERVREESASLRAPDEPRSARMGDVLVLDYEVRLEGDDDPERVRKDQEVELGKGMLLNQVEEALVGVRVGEVKVIPVDLPERPGTEPSEKKQIAFHATVKDIREKVLPEINDAFASDQGFEDIEKLRSAVRTELEKKVRAISDNVLKDQLLEALCDANPVDVPPTLVRKQAEQTEVDLARMFQIDFEKTPLPDDQKSQMRTQAERRVRTGLLLHAISKKESLDVSDEEIDARLAEIADQTGQPLPKVRAEYGKDDRREQLYSAMLQQKVVDLLLQRATITDTAPDTGAKEPKVEEGTANDEA